MPNIPQMGSVWAELGGAWVKATKGTGATPARSAFAQAQQEHPRQDRGRLSRPAPDGRAPCAGARLVLVDLSGRSSCEHDGCAHRAPPPRRRAPRQRLRARCRRGRSRFSGTVGLVVKIVLLAIVNALAIWAAAVLIDHHKWLAVTVLVARDAGDRRRSTCREAWTLPLKFLIPGTVFLLAFQVVPSCTRSTSPSTTTRRGTSSSKAEAIQAIQQNSLSEARAGRRTR